MPSFLKMAGASLCPAGARRTYLPVWLRGQVVFRRINMVSFTIVVYKKLHVACHLAAFQVAFQEEAFVDGFIPGWCPPFLEMFQLKRVKDIALVGCYVKRKNPGVDTS